MNYHGIKLRIGARVRSVETRGAKPYSGWLAGLPKNGGNQAYLVEVDVDRQNAFHDGGGTAHWSYTPRRKNNFLWILEIEPENQPARTQPKVSYKSNKNSKKGSVKVGGVWITALKERPKRSSVKSKKGKYK